jgi:hypothetical protein
VTTPAAVAATMGKAKVTGQVIDRAEVGNPGDFSNMTNRSGPCSDDRRGYRSI